MASNRTTANLATVLMLALAGAGCWFAARAAAGFIEERSRQDVALALDTAGHDWVQIDTDGLEVRLSGTAPSEVQRFRVLTQAASAVDSTRIVDDMQVASREAVAAPAFEVEMLRNDDGISLIGLVPAETDRDGIIAGLERDAAVPDVTDLLETADYPIPDGWLEAISFGLNAAQMAHRAKISIAPGKVSVTAITESREDKARLETQLRRAVPRGVVLETDISAPRPVIAPFTLRFVIDDEGARFDACAADSDAARQRIIAAATAAGAEGHTDCTLALGSPSPRWADAAVAGIEAVAALGSGTVTLSDVDISLQAPAGVPKSDFDEAVGRLEHVLPSVFSLAADLEKPAHIDHGPEEFTATVDNNGMVRLRGPIPDERMRDAVESIARARFTDMDSSLRSDDTVPGGWTVRVIAALEAMAPLKSGSATVSPQLVEIAGISGDPQASDRAAATLSQRLGAGARYQLAIRYDRRLDPALGLPDGPECVDRLNRIMSESAIGFEPNKSVIAGDPASTLEQLSGAMTDCTDFSIEAGGHTDSQGSEGFNAELSRARAQAVVAAMNEAGIDTGHMTVRGYGESQPVASNETDEGREANRRIEFRLMSELPIRTEPLPEAQVVSGVTGEAVPVPDAPADDSAGGAADAEIPPEAAAVPFGPPIPPLMLGATEEFVGMDERAENARVPVLDADADTPRPQPRPGQSDGSQESTDDQ